MLKAALDAIMEQNPFARIGDSVYQVLYEAIVGLSLTPGTVLSETALAKELDVSRTPIRSTFAHLAGEGLLESGSGQSFTVAGFKKDESRQLMEVRIPLEAQAAYLAAGRISTKQLSELEEHMKDFSCAFDDWNIKAMVTADSAFHQIIVDAADNRFIADLYRQLTPRITHYRNFLYNKAPKEQLMPLMGGSVRIHRAVCNAVRLGFADEARNCMERDIAGMSSIIGLWNE
jgi:DNA-binding GntR family transcriptional regulator